MYPLPHHLPCLPSKEKLISPKPWISPTHIKTYVCMYETCLPYKVDTAAVNPHAACHLAFVQHASRDFIVAIYLLACPCLWALSLSPMACHLIGEVAVFDGISLAPPEVRHLSADDAVSFLQLPGCVLDLLLHCASLTLVH